MATATDTRLITERDRALAKICLACPACRHARRKQRGLAFALVKRVETHVCPFCRAYAKVYGRQSHEPVGRSGPAPSGREPQH